MFVAMKRMPMKIHFNDAGSSKTASAASIPIFKKWSLLDLPTVESERADW